MQNLQISRGAEAVCPMKVASDDLGKLNMKMTLAGSNILLWGS